MLNPNHHGAPARGRSGAALGLILVAAVGLLGSACGGPQLKMLSDEHFKPLEPTARVDVFIGEIKPPYQEVAVIESDAFSYVDNEIKKKQLEQLKDKARHMGANVVQNVHILSKRVRGYTIDERVPFTAWQQGRYELYLMRGTAIRVPENEPTTMDEARPTEGWAIDKLTPPPRLAPLGSDSATSNTGWAVDKLPPPPRLTPTASDSATTKTM